MEGRTGSGLQPVPRLENADARPVRPALDTKDPRECEATQPRWSTGRFSAARGNRRREAPSGTGLVPTAPDPIRIQARATYSFPPTSKGRATDLEPVTSSLGSWHSTN